MNVEILRGIQLTELAPLDASSLPTEFRLFKFGDNATSKGVFKLDEQGAQSVLERYQKRGIELALDYEHDTFNASATGPRPAAGWFMPEVRADGLYAVNVRWTPRAAELLKNREYRYFSPTFEHVKGRIVGLLPSALTNFPATHDQPALVAARVDVVELAEWSTAFVDGLPDSSFLYVAPGGKKDGDGKTTPRSLRHFPVKDASGKPDMPHVRNALARIPDSKVPGDVKKRITAAAERMLGEKKTKTRDAMDVTKIVGLKDDASEADITARIESLVALEAKVLEHTGKQGIADAIAVLAVEKGETLDLVKRLSALEGDKWGATVDKAVAEFRLTPAEAAEYKKLGADDRAIAERMLALRSPAKPASTVVETKNAPHSGDARVAAQMAKLDEYKKAHPDASTADAFVACSAVDPELFREEA